MKFYVEIIPNEQMGEYLRTYGACHYTSKKVTIEAENESDVYGIARKLYPEFEAGHIESEADRKRIEEAKAKDAERETAREIRKAAREIEKAEELGMTMEEYKAYKRLKTKITTYKREVRRAKEQIEELQKEIERKEKWLAENA